MFKVFSAFITAMIIAVAALVLTAIFTGLQWIPVGLGRVNYEDDPAPGTTS